jgi:transposase
MLDLDTRTAILRLAHSHASVRAIARALGISRNSVRQVLRSGSATVPPLSRELPLTPYLEQVRQLHAACKGNLARVHEELAAQGLPVSYSTLTRFCRAQKIGFKAPKAAGRYHFEPGEEMQHDTSPHTVRIGDKERRVQCASLVLCYSRMIFAQVYLRWNRFSCKIFLTDALKYFSGAAKRAMIDNSSVVLGGGSGAEAIIAPEMEAFAARFGFRFAAHEPGDANRSARVERPFHYVENNFYPGRTFDDVSGLNQNLLTWCDKVNASYKKHLRARPIELFAVERTSLRPLPLHVPDVYALHRRVVDAEGYITLHTNRYSVPEELISREVEVHETRDALRVFVSHRLVAEHERREEGLRAWSTVPEHRRERTSSARRAALSTEELELCAAGPELGALLAQIKKHCPGAARRLIRRLHHLYLDYPDEPLLGAVREALHYGLLDVERIEKMILRRIGEDFFRLETP